MKHLIDAKAFLNVMPFVSTDKINIQAVQIRAGRIWATNGHLAIAHRLEQMDAHDLPDGVDRIEMSTTLCIKVDDVKRLTAFIKASIKTAGRWGVPYICYDTTSHAMSDIRDKTTMTLGEYDGEFPDFLKVLPKPESLQPVSHINVSGGYVGQLAALVGKGALGAVEIYGTGGLTEPMIVRPESGAWLAVVMPCNLSKDEVAAKKALEDLHADLNGRARPTRLSEEEKEALNAKACFETLKVKALQDHTDRLGRGVCPITARTVLIGALKTAKKVLENGGLHPEDIMAFVSDVTVCGLSCPSIDCPDDLREAKNEAKREKEALEDLHADLNGGARPTRLSEEEKQALADHADRLERGVCPVASWARAKKDLEIANYALTQNGLNGEDLDALLQPAKLCDTSCPFVKGNEEIACERFGVDCGNSLVQDVKETYAALNATAEDDEDALPTAVTQTDLTDGELALVEYALTPYEGE